MNNILIIGIFIALFQFVLLLTKQNKSVSDKILAVWMLIIAIHLSNYYLSINGYWNKYPHLVGLTAAFPFFYGPLLFLYVFYAIKSYKYFRTKDYLHFLPVLLTYLYLFNFYFFYTANQKHLVDMGKIKDYTWFTEILKIAFLLSGIIYTCLSYKLLNRYQSLLQQQYAFSEKINLNWLKGFIYGIGLVFSTATMVVISRKYGTINLPFNPDYIFYTLLILGLLTLGFYGIRHQHIFIDDSILLHAKTSKNTYQNSGLPKEIADEKHRQLIKFMRDAKPYLQPKLTLYSLAEQLEMSPHHLSQIINRYNKQNFNDFINHYRVEAFIQNVTIDPRLSYLAHAFDAGFNSKSSFNAVFKKLKGMTPSQYFSQLSNLKK